jgi:hypothetical protein
MESEKHIINLEKEKKFLLSILDQFKVRALEKKETYNEYMIPHYEERLRIVNIILNEKL